MPLNQQEVSFAKTKEGEGGGEGKGESGSHRTREWHLYTWVKLRGEEAVKTATKHVDNVAPPTLRPSRPLTIADYSKEGCLTSDDVRNKLQERQRQQERRKKSREALQALGHLRPQQTSPWLLARHKEFLDGRAARRAAIQDELYWQLEGGQEVDVDGGQKVDVDGRQEVEVDGMQEMYGEEEIRGEEEVYGEEDMYGKEEVYGEKEVEVYGGQEVEVYGIQEVYGV
jgi:hypothetical protein